MFSYTVVRRDANTQPGRDVPYIVAVIELDGLAHTRMVSNLVDCEIDEVGIGVAVSVTWRKVGGQTLPQFVLASAQRHLSYVVGCSLLSARSRKANA